ncbi:MAG: ABC transporter ATP-binding protein [Salinigranum sp.]
MTGAPLLEARDVTKHYPITEGLFRREVGRARAVDGVSLAVREGETLGLVGESGCGKSTLARLLVGLEAPTSGRVLFDGRNVEALSRRERRRVRRQTGVLFQDPASSLDPRMTVGESVAEPLAVHGLADRERRRAVAGDLLERVGLARADLDRYPHELSGGQKQRVALARALVTRPRLLVADEPVSALDASVRADILALLSSLRASFAPGVVLVSHDMRVVREACDRVAVMYLGEFVECGPTERVFDDPKHPYTRALTDAIPRLDPRARGRASELPGDVPSASNPPSGCRFHTRCPDIVPPEGLDIDREHWRAVMDFRARLEGGENRAHLEDGAVDRETIRASADEADGGGSDGSEPAAIRRRFGLPDRLPDADAERAVADAVEAVADGREGVARRRLAGAFETVCARVHPSLRTLEDGRSVACHLHAEPTEDDASAGTDEK